MFSINSVVRFYGALRGGRSPEPPEALTMYNVISTLCETWRSKCIATCITKALLDDKTSIDLNNVRKESKSSEVKAVYHIESSCVYYPVNT